MKEKKILLHLFLAALLIMFSCAKHDNSITGTDQSKKEQGLINQAKSFFYSNIETKSLAATGSLRDKVISNGERHFNKTPLWEKSYIINQKEKGEIVVTPLDYEKPLYFKSNFNNEAPTSIEEQSRLWIYKDNSGKYQAEVVIVLPDKKNRSNQSDTFAGYILEEDWNGNNISMKYYRNGNSHTFKKSTKVSLKLITTSNSENKAIVECDAIDWYECDHIDQYGVGTNCQYLYTEYVNCEVIGDDGGGGDGGGGGGGDGYYEPWGSGPMANLCGSYNFTTVGNAYVVSIKYLQQQWVKSGSPYYNFITNFVESCLTIPNYGITAYDAGQIFNNVFNSATATVLEELSLGLLAPTAQAVSARMKTLITTRLPIIKPGSNWATALCSGNVPQTEASWCP